MFHIQNRSKAMGLSRRALSLAIFVVLAFLATEMTLRLSRSVLSKGRSNRGPQAIDADRTGKSSEAFASRLQRPRLTQALGKLPMQFEANEGQADERVRFLSRGRGYGLFLTANGAVLELLNRADPAPAVDVSESSASQSTTDDLKLKSATLRMNVVGRTRHVNARALDPLPGTTNYFIGDDQNKWRTNVRAFQRVQYKNIYRGVDLVFYGNQQQLEYDFRVAPGVNPSRIKFAFDGARQLRIDSSGDLILATSAGDVRLHKPHVYQGEDGQKREIAGNFVLRGPRQIGFRVGHYDRTRLLVIDPSVVYASVFGGSFNDDANGIAVDTAGNAYVVGTTFSLNFPVVGGFQSTLHGGLDAFVTKVSPTGALVYSTYLGGTLDDQGRAIAVDPAGAAYVTGSTQSTNFPTANPLQGSNAGGFTDVFVTKINPAGSALVYSTYVGGTDQESGNGMAVDSNGNAIVTGYTQSSTFPTKAGSFQTTFGGGTCFTNRPCGDAFVVKLNPAGSAFVYSTFLGGNGNDNLDFAGNSYGGIAADGIGNAYVTGVTSSTNFPTLNPLQSACNVCTSFAGDAFVTKLNPAGTGLVYSTYVGGTSLDIGRAIALDSSQNAYITGNTESTDFPTTNGAFQTTAKGGFDGFVAKVGQNGSSLGYSTYLAGNLDDVPNGIAVDSSGNAYISGTTSSTDFPTANAIQAKGGGSLFKTTNGATSWSVINSNLPPISYALVVNPTNPNVLYVGNSLGVAVSTDGGSTWSPTTFYNDSVFSLALDPNNPSVIYGGLFNGIIKSADGGNAWTTTTAGLTNAGLVGTIAIDPTNTQVLYAATTNGGVFKSTDGGVTWSAINIGITDLLINTLVIDRTTPTTLYLGNSKGVSKTTNAGASWSVTSTGLPPLLGSFVDGLAFDPTTTSTIFATTAAIVSTQGGVFKSTNGGASWNTLLRTNFTMGSIVVDRTNANTVYAATSASTNTGLPNSFSGVGILKSTDGGTNWTPSGLTQDFVQGLIFDATNPFVIYAPASGGNDMFVTGLNASGSAALYSTYFGGTGAEQGNAIAVDTAGQVYLAGATASMDYPGRTATTPPTEQTTIAAKQPDEAVVTKIGCQFEHVSVTKSLVQFHSDTKKVEFEVIAKNNGPGATALVGVQDLTYGLPQVMSAKPGTSGWTCSLGGCTKVMAMGEEAKFTVLAGYSSGQIGGQHNFAFASLLNGCDSNPGTDESITISFTIPPQPKITHFSPDSGLILSTVTMIGAGFTGATGVEIGGIPVTDFTVNSDTQITLTVPPGAMTGLITVSNQAWSTLSATPFTVMPTTPPPPVLDIFSPNSGGWGAVAFVFGLNLNPPSGQLPPVSNRAVAGQTTAATSTVVKFNGVQAPITSITDTQIVTQVPTGATTGPITVTTAGGTATSSTNFVVTATSSIQFSAPGYTVGEGAGFATINVTRTGDTSSPATVDYATSDSGGSQNCNVFNGKASSRCDYITGIGTLRFAAGETSKTIPILIVDDAYAEGPENFSGGLSNAVGASLGAQSTASVTIVDNDSVTGANPIDNPNFFVPQNYNDFLNREPDVSGLNFWTNEISSCGADQSCIEVKRINVSAAFYLSIEFQDTGYLVERIYKTAYGDAAGTSTLGGPHQLSVPVIRFNEFLPDTQEIGLGVVVGQGSWQQMLENNKQAFTGEFVQRTRFTTAFPNSMTAAQFVDKLNTNAGNPLSPAERNQLVSDLSTGAKTRAQTLRTIAENQNVGNAEFNRAFVLMQFFGYLRRNPNDPQDTDYTGYDFWLTKLNQFNGNFQNAEMVKAFINSSEYRQRFGP